MHTVFIGIGSNLGEPDKNCLEAVKRIEQVGGCKNTGVSRLYLTEPVGVEDQPWYVNCVMSISTNLSARRLMNILLRIESAMGRVREKKWESRNIDLDILLFDNEIISEENLTIPHPLMHKRRFVVAPIVDLAPNLIHPFLGKTMSELLDALPDDEQTVKLLEDQ
jgi:2-amino-4-hydroxy-6-hydroxymethyldihydropteridine diphosphokinase